MFLRLVLPLDAYPRKEMLTPKSFIVLQSGGVLARGVTIATRYAAVRRQFQDRDAKEWETGENQILNYVGSPSASKMAHTDLNLDNGSDQVAAFASCYLRSTFHWAWHDGTLSREPEEDVLGRW